VIAEKKQIRNNTVENSMFNNKWWYVCTWLQYNHDDWSASRKLLYIVT
jgi:hypothetical protein